MVRPPPARASYRHVLTVPVPMVLPPSSVERRQLVWRQHHANRTRLADSSRDQPTPLKGQDHLMDGWWRHVEVTLDIRLRRWTAVQFRVHRDERKVLSLKLCKRRLADRGPLPTARAAPNSIQWPVPPVRNATPSRLTPQVPHPPSRLNVVVLDGCRVELYPGQPLW